MSIQRKTPQGIAAAKRYEEELASYPDTPLGVVRNGGTWPTPRFRTVLCTCARWEERYIVEWLLYHQSIGIDHVYIYCNDDDPTELYHKVLPFATGPQPFVTFRHYAFQGLQYEMYFHFLRNYLHESEWMMFLDIDEFICIPGANEIGALLASMPPGAHALYLNWLLFGHAGHATRPDGDVLLHYTRRSRALNPFTKVLIKSSRVPMDAIFRNKNSGFHHDYSNHDGSINPVNVLGEPLNDYYRGFPDLAGLFLAEDDRNSRIIEKGFIAHFHVKSEHDFQLRVLRGVKGDFHAQTSWLEKTEHEHELHRQITNEVEDTYLRDYWITLRARAWTHSIFPPAHWALLSAGKPAAQSSTAHACTPAEDAARIVSGHLVGGSQNHTLLEPYPWWMLDLEVPCLVHEIRIFNRMDGAFERMSRFVVQGALAQNAWTNVLVRDDATLFGGADGFPFIWVSDDGVPLRYLRLTVPGVAYLHLDQIQVFGTPLEAA